MSDVSVILAFYNNVLQRSRLENPVAIGKIMAAAVKRKVNFDAKPENVQDANGYNPEIFVERDKFVENFQCAICKWIVKDCVEISCMDDDIHKNDINSLNYNTIWCLKCLENYLNKNKQVCPINDQKHEQNIKLRAVANRYTQRQVSRARVKCVNGHIVDQNCETHGRGWRLDKDVKKLLMCSKILQFFSGIKIENILLIVQFDTTTRCIRLIINEKKFNVHRKATQTSTNTNIISKQPRTRLKKQNNHHLQIHKQQRKQRYRRR